MYVKFQYVDTSNCFHILNSTRPTPSIGISIPPTKKYKDKNQLHDPNGKIEKNKNLGVKFRHGVGYSNDDTQNGFLRKPVDKTEIEEKIDGQLSSKCSNEVKCAAD
ncbi:hypothetical protein RND71_020547 [Anisodus tanguticus]|uniref:Uncharacterized protein n=1 Tax=Anisodus tanguticus TaxID=243964 RepID=A0AAE1S196_9SOLA|nr:hypothetical protein RND71_020547 [Anisodus tanguticus]